MVYKKKGVVKKHIIMEKYQTLRLNILPHLIITNLQVKYLMQRQKKKG